MSSDMQRTLLPPALALIACAIALAIAGIPLAEARTVYDYPRPCPERALRCRRMLVRRQERPRVVSTPSTVAASTAESSTDLPAGTASDVAVSVDTPPATAFANSVRPSTRTTAFGLRILDLVNSERAAAGLPPLEQNDMLQQSAQDYAEDMADRGFFGHRDPEGRSSTDRIRSSGYLAPPCDCTWTYRTGENLARGQATSEEVMDDWMRSEPHRSNILDPHFTELGVGRAGEYWVQHFGRID